MKRTVIGVALTAALAVAIADLSRVGVWVAAKELTLVFSGTPNQLAKFDGAGTGVVDSMITESSGKIGIGVTSPARTLDVAGPIRSRAGIYELHDGTTGAGGLYFHKAVTGQGSSLSPVLFAEDTLFFMSGGSVTPRMVVDTTGKIGIGTTSPGRALDVAGEIRSRNGVLELHNGGDLGGGLYFNKMITGTGTSLEPTLFAEGSSGRLHFATGGSAESRVLFDANGNVGIGTTTPTKKLHVVGDVHVTGNIAAKYQDVAEWVEATEPLDPGTVVVIAPDRVNVVRPSGSAYAEAVAGVVSSQPGVTLGEAGAGKITIAQSGRVRVRVDASYGPIRAGDLLVTSPTPGYAMRSIPLAVGGAQFHRPGTILGKALQPLQQGRGEVLVLVTLQ